MAAIWKIAPGKLASEWDWCRDNRCIAVDWLNETDLSEFRSAEEIAEALEQAYQSKPRSSHEQLWQFAKDIKKGHIVVANKGLRKIVGIGKITSDYLAPDHDQNPSKENDDFGHAFLVNWIVCLPVDLPRKLSEKQDTVQRLDSEQWLLVKRAYEETYPDLKGEIDSMLEGNKVPIPDLPAERGSDDTGEREYTQPSEDHRKIVIRQIKDRRGQEKFRNDLRKRYGDRCLVTGCELLDVLEAAHIDPHRNQQSHHPANGLLLRADIHTLFDLDLIGIEPHTMTIDGHPSVANDTQYAEFVGQQLKCTKQRRPSMEALNRRFIDFQKRLAKGK